MPKLKTLEERYDSCIADGCLKNLSEVNIQKIKSLIQNAETNINSAKIIAKTVNKQAREWMNVYTLHYEAIRTYAEALLQFKEIKAANHQCLFASLCIRYTGLELDWNFFEKIRTKRHGTNYYGEQITYEDWKSVELQMNLYISSLKKELEKRLA